MVIEGTVHSDSGTVDSPSNKLRVPTINIFWDIILCLGSVSPDVSKQCGIFFKGEANLELLGACDSWERRHFSRLKLRENYLKTIVYNIPEDTEYRPH